MKPPPGAPHDPIARRIRARRLELGLTLERLAARAAARMAGTPGRGRARAISTSYLSLIENGRKVPEEPVAVALAEALGEDVALFSAWVSARKRADLGTALAAARTLVCSLGDTAAGDLPARVAGASPGGAGSARAPRPAAPGGTPARLRVPVVPSGADPGEGVRPTCQVLGWRALDPDALPESLRARLRRPFAFRIDAAAARHCAPWPAAAGWDAPPPPRAGDHVVILRDFEPLEPGALCAVRVGGALALRRLVWNGRTLLLLPSPGGTDFDVVAAPDAARLRALVVGRAVRVDMPVVG